MSYAWELADRAKLQLLNLETWLQEETLDELDELAASATPQHPQGRDEFVHDFVRVHNGTRFYVFLTVSLDASRQVLRILTIGSYSRRD